DLVIDLEVHSKYSSIVTALSFAKNRAGFGGITSRFRTGLYTHLVYWNPTKFVGKAYEQLLSALNVEPITKNYPLSPTNDGIKEVNKFLSDNKLNPENDLLVCINVNASSLRPERKWPPHYFAKLIEELVSAKQVKIILVGAPNERNYVEYVCSFLSPSLAKEKVFNSAGILSLAGFVALLKVVKLMISNDSGPMHIAQIMNVPLVSLWGPTDPAVYCPEGENHLAIYKPIYCSPCTHFSDIPPCRGDNQCLKLITWEEVAEASFQLLGLPYIVRKKSEREDLKQINKSLLSSQWKRKRLLFK
ncbi:MAG: glycosyltransferase family 9 protein, partial [Candidatus Dadabacteria bacterium]